MQQGDTDGALDFFNRAVGVAGQAGASQADVPQDAPFSGLRGGAASLGQRLELHRAMARCDPWPLNHPDPPFMQRAAA